MCENSTPDGVIKHCFWNIQGYKSQILGNKLLNQDFLDEIKGSDIVGLAETHIHAQVLSNLDIPGYDRKHFKNRKAHSNGKCGSGGIAVFCKPDISKLISIAPNAHDDVIWIKIGRGVYGDSEDTYLGTCYIPPNGNKENTAKKFEKLGEEIAKFQSKGRVILQGDFNARINTENDTIDPDKYDEQLGLSFTAIPSRNSEDTGETNIRGVEFLNMCKALNMTILNGRKSGDLFGKYTSINWNGRAVVDFGVVPVDSYEAVSSFTVGSYAPFISDHCPIIFDLRTLSKRVSKPDETLKEPPKVFRINDDDLVRLKETLQSPAIAEKLNGMNSCTNPQSLATNITNTLIEACTLSEMRLKKTNISTADKPWFDRECQTLKNNIKKKCKILRMNKSDSNLQRQISSSNKELKKLIIKKKNEYKLEIVNKMNLTGKNQKYFWRLLDKLDGSPHDNMFKDLISGDRWVDHFKKVLREENRDISYPEDSANQGPLDHRITMEELNEAEYVLRPDKSTGYDSLSNEIIKCLVETNPRIILKLFNLVFDSNAKIEQWAMAILTPILKSGPKMDPSNYRGISILSCLGKLYTAILNKRLMKYAVERGILKPEALGFVAGNRTSDAHLVIHSLIQRYCHQENRKIFSCFVDFSKAFDTIPRDLLFKKLLDYGINGKFFNNIKTMYTNDNCCVKVGNKLTESFPANQGVKQGCILSPLLFNIFLADIVERFTTENCRPIKIDESQNLGCLLWADDIILLSHSEEGLRNMLSALSSYVDENGMSINTKKTQCMIFNKTGKFIRRSYPMKNGTIETTNSYKYLGFIFTPSGEIVSGLKDLRDRALRAYHKLKHKMGLHFRLHPFTTISLFDSLIKPILLYSSDFWGCLKMPNNNPIENLYMKFCKALLGVQKQTSNIGVLLELGAVPIMFFGIKNCLKNWHRIHKNSEANSIVLKVHQMASEHNLPWPLMTKNQLDSIGITPESDIQNIHKVAFEKLKENFYRESFEEISSEHSKLRTYAKLKTEIGIEDYLNSIENVRDRTALTKIRLSNHTLMIEKGRHQGLQENQRFCPFCDNKVENEYHFIMECNTFDIFRQHLFVEIREINNTFNILDDNEKFIFLLSKPEAGKMISEYLNKTLQIRSFLVENYKQNG